MDLQQLATNARLNHWPPHLGVTTEAEKIECLAAALVESEERQVSDSEVRTEMQNEIDRLRDKAQDLEDQINSLRDNLDTLEEKLDQQ